MSRFLSWFILLPIGVVAVVFAVFNRQDVVVNLWPSPFILSAPSWALVLSGCLIGFMLGGVSTWLAAAPGRSKARSARWRSESLERDLTLAQEKLRKLADDAAAPHGAPQVLPSGTLAPPSDP